MQKAKARAVFPVVIEMMRETEAVWARERVVVAAVVRTAIAVVPVMAKEKAAKVPVVAMMAVVARKKVTKGSANANAAKMNISPT